MIVFAPLRTRRLSVRLRELEVGQSIELLSMPPELLEGGTTEFLRYAAVADKPTPAHVTDPRMMTVQERMHLCAHYLAHVSESGADFEIGDGRYSQFVMPGNDWDGRPAPITLDKRKGSLWPLFGWQAEVLEKICQNRGQWQLSALACQIIMEGESLPDGTGISDADAIEWVTKRRDAAKRMTESEYKQLFIAAAAAETKIAHFFHIGFQDDGVIALPTPEAIKEAGAKEIAPARFPFDACVSDFTRQLFGKTVQPGG
jgi:hypothetical protein